MKLDLYSRSLASAAIALAFGFTAGALPAQAQSDQIQVQGDQAQLDKLRWAPPTLVNPIVLELGDGPTDTRLDDGQDYVIKLPKTKKVGATIIEGGRNVVIIGGYITLPAGADQADVAHSSAIFIRNNLGTVHIEGVLIDASARGMSDGIDIESPRSTVQIENVRVDGVYGFHNEFHAHVIKPFGGVAALRVDKLTGYSGYQGLTLDTELGRIGSADINRVNLVAIRKQVWGPGNNGGQMVWLTKDGGCGQVYPIRFGDVYVQPRAGTPLSRAVWPMATGGVACAARSAGNESEVSFPGLPVEGQIQRGLPEHGDFVPAGVAGVGYVTPGYRSGSSGSEEWIARVQTVWAAKTAVRTQVATVDEPSRVQAGGSQ